MSQLYITDEDYTKEQLRGIHMYMTNEVLPELAEQNDWCLKHNHCFQRVILDEVCGDEWYDYIDEPAYRNMDKKQLEKAVSTAEQIITRGNDYLKGLNHLSLEYRGKL